MFLSYVSARGHTLLDCALYVPKRWFDDPERCREAGIAQETRFQTKCELASTMVERVLQAKSSISWVVADCVYGSNAPLRAKLQANQYWYVLAVRCTEAIVIQTPTGRMRMSVQEAEIRFIAPADWQRLSMGEGSKGPLWFDWACLPILDQCEDDGQHWLLIRRLTTDPSKKVFYLVFGPISTTLSEMVAIISARWGIEEDFEMGKDIGLGEYEVRTSRAWYRHITLVMLALAVLAPLCAHDQADRTALPESMVPQPRLLAVTRPEVRHLLAHLIWPHPHNISLLLAWSWWRRCHRSIACYYHTKRRREKGDPVIVSEDCVLCLPLSH